MQKPNIKKMIDNRPKGPAPKHNANPFGHKGSLMDSPMVAMAQGFIENMETKHKVMIGGVVYLLLAGVVGTGVGIVKLITLIF